MMMNESIYRLGEYRIIEYDNGQPWWERHFALGVQRRGKCFIHDEILIIGHWSYEEPGYLILEFFERLQKLPAWNKTRYYCFSFELLDIATGQSLTNDFLERNLRRTNSAGSKSVSNLSPGMFRLGRYQITVTDKGDVSWQTYGGLDRVVCGRCIIESDVLFIDPQQYDGGNQSKREFLNKLKQLPKWEKSMAWCRNLVLRECQYEQQAENPIFATNHQDTTDKHSFDEKQSTFYLNQYKEPPKRLLQSGFKWPETTLHRIRGGKGWLKYLVPLFVVGLLLGLVVILHSVEEKSHLPHWDKHHHREHDDD